MVIAYHLIWTAYGWWLPNDPRGSTSQCIRCDVIGELGAIHYGRKRVQPASREIRAFYERATPQLEYPALMFKLDEFRVIGDAFGEAIHDQGYTCYACAIMPDHVHLLIRKHRDAAEEMIRVLQRASHLKLRDAGIREFDHPVWGGPGWKVFLDTPEDIRRTVTYIEPNPTKEHMPAQSWDFVSLYDGWRDIPRPRSIRLNRQFHGP